MELWIRSQDKELLVLAKGFEFQSPSYNGGCQIFAVWQNNYQCVGNYKSKERALEILNEIQNYLINSTFAKIQNGLGEDITMIPNPTFVYEMPEE